MQGGKLTHEQRFRLKKDECPCPDVKVKSRSYEAVYRGFSWICGDSEKKYIFLLAMFSHGRSFEGKTNTIFILSRSYNYFIYGVLLHISNLSCSLTLLDLCTYSLILLLQLISK